MVKSFKDKHRRKRKYNGRRTNKRGGNWFNDNIRRFFTRKNNRQMSSNVKPTQPSHNSRSKNSIFKRFRFPNLNIFTRKKKHNPFIIPQENLETWFPEQQRYPSAKLKSLSK